MSQTSTSHKAHNLVVDSQVHIWIAESPDRPWPPGGVARANLPEPFTYDRLLVLMNEAGVDRVVIVPPFFEGERNDYALEAAKKYPDRFAVMGRILLNSPEAPALLRKWKDQPGMLGIRLTFNWNQFAWLTDGTADWFWPAAAKAGVPVMVHPNGMILEFAHIAESNPRLTLIIDHMGLSTEIAKSNIRERAIEQTLTLAKYPNVYVKVSSVPTYSFEPYPYRDMDEFVRRVVDAFGPRRCFWGSDLTVSFDRAFYRQRISHFTEELDFLSADDKEWIMGRAILSCLGWERASSQIADFGADTAFHR
jgi:predicted TIM-barrel fold metal-dependent hydrolase